MSIGNLTLEQWLRYGFSGAVGLIAFVWIKSPLLVLGPTGSQQAQQASILPFQVGAGTITLLLGLALVIGTFVYALHRAVIYPLLYGFVLLFLALWRHGTDFEWDLLIPLRPSGTEIRFYEWHWRSLKQDRFWACRLAEWGAQMHFLYCCAWAAALAVVLGFLLGEPNPQASYFLCWFSILVALSALASDLRLTFVVKNARENWHEQSGNGE